MVLYVADVDSLVLQWEKCLFLDVNQKQKQYGNWSKRENQLEKSFFDSQHSIDRGILIHVLAIDRVKC